jgi:putative oxidoreductase
MIKKILNPGFYSREINIAILFLRVSVGIFMLTHGTGKLMALLSGGPVKFADPIGIGPAASLALAVFAEVICSLFLIFGIATRFSAIPLIITMLVAGFIVHAEDLFRVKEMAFLYLSTFITIAISGAGKFSVDNLIYKKIRS